MLDSIWQLLANNGLNTEEIATSIQSLFYIVGEDAEGKAIYGGSLKALGDFPVIGTVLKALASFAPAVENTTLS